MIPSRIDVDAGLDHSGLPAELRKLLNPICIHAKTEAHNEISEIPIESDLFVGKMIIIVANVPGEPKSYFSGRKRKFRVLVQGRFKHALQFSSVYTGQVFDEPMTSLPAKWLVRAVLQLISRLQPGFRTSMRGDKPYLLAPLVSAAQAMVISRIGNEPLTSALQDIEEDVSLLGKKYYGMSRKRRKAHFSARRNLEKHFFDPNLVYTFDFYQHHLNLASFQVDFGFMKYDLIKFLGARPLQIMAVAWDPTKPVKPDQYQQGSLSDHNDSSFCDEFTGAESPTSHSFSGISAPSSILPSSSVHRGMQVLGSRASPPAVWPYVYNIEVWHERAIAANTQSGGGSDPDSRGLTSFFSSLFGTHGSRNR